MEFRDFSPPALPSLDDQHDALAKGLGRAMQWAFSGKLNDEPLLDACTRNLRYDRQCEQQRGDWHWRLLQASGSARRLRNAIFQSAQSATDGYQRQQLCAIASGYAQLGDEPFRRWLYSICQDFYDRDAAKSIITLDGLAGLVYVARAFGAAVNDDTPWATVSIYEHAEAALGKEAAWKTLLGGEHPALKRFRDIVVEERARQTRNPSQTHHPKRSQSISVEEVIETVESGSASYGWMRRIGMQSTDEEACIYMDRLLAARNPTVIANYLRMFASRTFPFFDSRILQFCDSEDESIRWKAYQAVERNQSLSIRELAESLLSNGIHSGIGVGLFIRNFRPGDEDSIVRAIDWPPHNSQRHTLLMDAIKVLESNPNADRSKLGVIAYALNPCSMCREDAARLLLKKAAAPDWLAMECRYDCVDETRSAFELSICSSGCSDSLESSDGTR